MWPFKKKPVKREIPDMHLANFLNCKPFDHGTGWGVVGPDGRVWEWPISRPKLIDWTVLVVESKLKYKPTPGDYL